jgi:hypothetical protein
LLRPNAHRLGEVLQGAQVLRRRCEATAHGVEREIVGTGRMPAVDRLLPRLRGAALIVQPRLQADVRARAAVLRQASCLVGTVKYLLNKPWRKDDR